MKLKEKQLNYYRERFKKSWDYYALVGDAWLSGYEQALNNVFYNGTEATDMGDTNVEVTYEKGEHQTGAKFSSDDPESN